MNVKVLLLGALIVFCGCTSTEKKSASAKEETSPEMELPHEATDLPAANVIRERVVEMYNDVFEHYRREDYNPANYVVYFSDSLLSLWNELPDSEVVVDADPWTWTQDYDKLAFSKIEAMVWGLDSARAWVTLNLYNNVGPDTMQLKLVREQHADKDSADWYVADFSKKGAPDSWSVVSIIKDYIAERDKQKAKSGDMK